ncbi:GT2 family glycosyltransferase [Pseudorhizobium tarimense]|uniref:GT2 family glycosyltransferase n=1 Tax=Pseudorhizobium tarimense TaxID=1079109 RepID=A0ABV2H544_9HYPH|nr:glycosyltransferase [Pseudorhizobium tarimense]MCJ8518611.1 glycosyltransferase [Pseudorhizobium tarimense]
MTKPGTVSARHTVAVGIPTSGRSEIVSAVVPDLVRQTRKPDQLLICAPTSDDVDMATLADLPFPVRFLQSERGLCRQRNAIIDAIPDIDIVLFLDDDFLLAPTYIVELERLFLQYPSVDVVTGTVLADGATGPGISVDEGLALLCGIPAFAHELSVRETYSGYGCNMAVRMSTVRAGALRFDERLPLYGWLEDLDFSRTVSRFGQVVASPQLLGVHLGTKNGRISGLRLGYSQIANPIYLARKRTMTWRHALIQMARNVAANTSKASRAEPWVDRKGRLRGNLLALRDLCTGHLSPLNICGMN